MSGLRKVAVQKWEQREELVPVWPGSDITHPRKFNVKVDAGEALFHQFGVAYEEFENGPGNFSTAIIEFPDGHVESICVEMIRFLEPSK